MKPVHLNDKEFRSYDIAGNLDKQYVLVGYHSFVKSGQHIVVFLTPHQPTTLVRQHELVIGHRLN